MKPKKCALFITLLPEINALIKKGYYHEDVTKELLNHGLDISVMTFRTYLQRYNKSYSESKSESKLIEDKPELIGMMDTSKPENISSLLSKNISADNEHEDEDEDVNNVIKGSIKRSKQKAFDLLNSSSKAKR